MTKSATVEEFYLFRNVLVVKIVKIWIRDSDALNVP